MTDSGYTYLSKAAIQICKAIGAQELLREYDHLRIKLKSNAAKSKTKPSNSERKKYILLLSQLQTQVLSTKYTLKMEIKKIETESYQKHGLLPGRSRKDYDDLRKKLDYIRKLLAVWHNYELTSNTDLSLHPPRHFSLSLTSHIYILLLSLSLYKYYIIHTKLNSLCMMYNLMVSSPPTHTLSARSLTLHVSSPNPPPPFLPTLCSLHLSFLYCSPRAFPYSATLCAYQCPPPS